jgi:transposase InsO family protein
VTLRWVAAGSSCSSPSMTTAASRSPTCIRMNANQAQYSLLKIHSLTSALWAFAYAPCSPTTVRRFARKRSDTPAHAWVLSSASPALTAHRRNGKAERFIQSALREWAYGVAYNHSSEREQMLERWRHHYNWHRPHHGIARMAPISRLTQSRNNLLTFHN